MIYLTTKIVDTSYEPNTSGDITDMNE